MRAGLAIAIAFMVAACGSAAGPDDGSSSASQQRGASDDAGASPMPEAAPTPTPPQLPAPPSAISEGGRVLAAPRVVAITFDGDPARPTIESLVAAMPGAYWSQVTSEYGVGPLAVGAPIHVAAAAPRAIDDEGIARWLRATIATPDPDAIYAVFYPAGTSVTYAGFAGCDAFAGYHGEALVSGAPLSYAVIPRCDAMGDLAGDALLTTVASHEIVESATNPHPASDAAWDDVDDAHAIWSLVTGGELGDLCGARSIALDGASLVAQRVWSNASARAGHDPCVPAPADPYFVAAPVDADDVTVLGRPSKGLVVAMGDSRTVDVVLGCDGAPCDPWDVEAVDLIAASGGPPEVDLSLDRARGAAGDVLKLTIRPLAIDPVLGGEAFALVSRRGDRSSTWYGFVAN